MAAHLIGLAVGSLALVLYYGIIYPLFLSPLAKIPSAHPTAALSSFWIEYHRRIGREIRCIYDAHRRHGPVVRLGPKELSVASLDGLRKIYVGGLEKHNWYKEFMNYGRPNLFTMLRRKEHSERKRMTSGVYSKSYLLKSPDLAACCRVLVFDRLLPVLLKAADGAEHVDVQHLNGAAKTDFMSAYHLGLQNGTNFICDEGGFRTYIGNINARLRGLPNQKQAAIEMEDFYMRMCEAAEREVGLQTNYPQETVMDDGTRELKTQRVVFAQLLQCLEKSGLPPAERKVQVASEMCDNIVAGHENGAVTLTYVMYELSRNRHLQDRLRAELQTLDPPITLKSGKDSFPTLKALDSLAFLDAILHETLRIHTASPAPEPRLTPSGGIIIDNYGPLPAGIRVSSSPYVLHRNPDVWPDPEVWQPERWLPGGKGATEDMRRWFWAFSSGGRMCIGNNLALLGEL